MRRVSILHPKVFKFRNDLVDYANLLNAGQIQAAAQLRSGLNVQWGDLQSDLERLGINRFYQQFGRTFPIFESALQSPGVRFSGAPLEALEMAVSELEAVIGKLNRLREEGTPIRHSFWITGFVLTFIAGWLVRHYQDQILLLRRLPTVTTWADKKVLFIALASGVSGITGNLFADVARTDGWIGSLRRHPIQFFVYLLLSLGLLVYVGRLAATP